MAEHYLHLHPEPFHLVNSGVKTIESRLFDEKRRTYSVGDELIFTNRADESETVEVEITQLHKADSFHELFNQNDLMNKFGSGSPDELEKNIKKYYSEKDQERYGVIGIEFTKSHQ